MLTLGSVYSFSAIQSLFHLFPLIPRLVCSQKLIVNPLYSLDMPFPQLLFLFPIVESKHTGSYMAINLKLDSSHSTIKKLFFLLLFIVKFCGLTNRSSPPLLPSSPCSSSFCYLSIPTSSFLLSADLSWGPEKWMDNFNLCKTNNWSIKMIMKGRVR